MPFTDFPDTGLQTDVAIFGRALLECRTAQWQRWWALTNYLYTQLLPKGLYGYTGYVNALGQWADLWSYYIFNAITVWRDLNSVSGPTPYNLAYKRPILPGGTPNVLELADYDGMPVPSHAHGLLVGPGRSAPWGDVLWMRYALGFMIAQQGITQQRLRFIPPTTWQYYYVYHYMQFLSITDTPFASVTAMLNAAGYPGGWDNDKSRPHFPFVLRQLTDVLQLLKRFRYRRDDPVGGNVPWSYHGLGALTYG